MAEKLKAFRWLGPGSLHVRRGDVIRVVPPASSEIKRSCIVKDTAELESLGATRIKEIIEGSQGEYVTLVEGALDLLGKDGGQELKDAQEAQTIAQEAATSDAAARANADKAQDLATATARPAPSQLPPETARGDVRSVVPGAPAAGPKE